jgi:hypothetical protein
LELPPYWNCRLLILPHASHLPFPFYLKTSVVVVVVVVVLMMARSMLRGFLCLHATHATCVASAIRHPPLNGADGFIGTRQDKRVV